MRPKVEKVFFFARYVDVEMNFSGSWFSRTRTAGKLKTSGSHVLETVEN